MAKASALTPEMLAAFQARGGAVKKVAVDAGLGLTNRQWYRKARDDDNARIVQEMDVCEEQRSEMAMEAFHQARHAGASQEVAMDDYNYVRNRR